MKQFDKLFAEKAERRGKNYVQKESAKKWVQIDKNFFGFPLPVYQANTKL